MITQVTLVVIMVTIVTLVTQVAPVTTLVTIITSTKFSPKTWIGGKISTDYCQYPTDRELQRRTSGVSLTQGP